MEVGFNGEFLLKIDVILKINLLIHTTYMKIYENIFMHIKAYFNQTFLHGNKCIKYCNYHFKIVQKPR